MGAAFDEMKGLNGDVRPAYGELARWLAEIPPDVLDRAVTFDTDLYDALKIGLISMDSTMRYNLAVGLPIDILVARRDACDAEVNYRIETGEPYFQDLRERWSGALRAAHMAIPRPPYHGAG